MHTRRAFSLIEMVLSMSILAIIMGSLASLMMLTSRSLPSAEDSDVADAELRRQLQSTLSHFSDTTSILKLENKHILAKVSDMTGDGAVDAISLTHDDEAKTLVLDINGQTATVCDDVKSFEISVDSFDRSSPTTSGTIETPDVLIDAYTNSSDSSHRASKSNVVWMRIRPTLGPTATEYRITRVRAFVIPIAGKDTAMSWGITDSTSSGTPNISRVRATANLAAATYTPAGQWITVNFASNTYWHAAADRPFISVASSATAGEIDIATDTLAAHEGYLYYSKFLSVDTLPNAAMLYEVYATVRSPGTTTSTQTHARSLTITVARTGRNVVTTSIPLRNQPTVP
jgi:prepilin-type N-terminal cleavage/methylation domain-containing protein